jgi:tRNA-uridine 2-sulfurtransferase
MASPTVLLGMSGGVDSCVAAALLIEQGYDVHGVTLQVWEHEDDSAASKRWQERGCCKVGIAKYVAQRLGISHEVIDTRQQFRHAVIDDFVSGYLSGTTPNPCVRCNERVKLRSLVDLADERSLDFVATGHYAQIVHEDGEMTLRRAADTRKDQTYFLYRLHRTWLPKLLFPVGSLQKTAVWERAEALGLPTDELKESQEICFVSQGDYRTFIQNEAPQSRMPGSFIDPQGRVLGQHEGIAYYTPGQRRGLKVATGERLYVHQVLPDRNTVVLGPEDGLFRSECTVSELNLLAPHMFPTETTVDVKVRYATAASPGTLQNETAGTFRVLFDQPQRALTPGQSAVFYRGDRVLGGGIIQ